MEKPQKSKIATEAMKKNDCAEEEAMTSNLRGR